MKEIPEEQMDEILQKLTAGLGEVFDGIADVQCIKGNKDEIMSQMMSTYMDYPILEVKSSRKGTNISVNKCTVEDIINVLPKTIGSLLSLVPNKHRNDILYKAIQVDMTENGGLLDDIDEKEMEENDE